MSDQDNPYKAPETTATTIVPDGDLNLPDAIRNPLVKTAPWKRFIAIMGFIGAGFMALAGVLIIAAGSAFASAMDMAGLGGGMGVFMGLIYIAMAALYLFPALYLYRSGKALKVYQETSSSEDLMTSAVNEGKLWKFLGVLYIISLSLGLLVFVISIIAGIASAF